MPIIHETEKTGKWNKETQKYDILHKAGDISHVGLVIRIWTDPSVRIMSDVWAPIVYATVWDEERQETTEYTLELHDSCGGVYASAEVDATPEVLVKYEAYKARKELDRQESARLKEIERFEIEHNKVERGKRMMVTRGRKVAKGTTGKVFWLGVDHWGNTKAGLALSDERDSRGRYSDVVWVNAGYLAPCEKFQVPSHLATPVCELKGKEAA